MSGPHARNIVLGVLERAVRRLILHLGPDVGVTQDNLSRLCRLVLICLDAKLPPMEGLRWHMCQPMNRS
jgi:hypothetical protein